MATFDFSTYSSGDPLPSEFTGDRADFNLTGTHLVTLTINSDGHTLLVDSAADGFVSARFGGAQTEWMRLNFRYVDADNLWQILFRQNSAIIKLLKREGGVNTTISDYAIPEGINAFFKTISAEFNGDTIEVYYERSGTVAKTLVGTHTDTFNQSATISGMAVGNPIYEISEFSYTDPAAGNTAPVANAGTDQSVTTGTPVQLDGSGSSDPDVGDTLTYLWSLTVPVGSSATLSSTTAVNPTFTPDIDGEYIASLIVNDGTVDSASDNAVITASQAQTTQVLNFDIPASFQNTPNANYVLIPIGNNASIANGVLNTSSATVQIDVNSLGLTTGETIVIYASDINASNDATAKVMWDKSTVTEV